MSEEKKICPICTFPTSLPLINGKCVNCLSPDELEIYYKQLVEMESNSSEIENYQESLNEIKENIIGARKLVMDIEGRMLLITK